jgi:hypothetical protein
MVIHQAGVINARMGLSDSVHRIDFPDSDLIIPVPPEGMRIVSPTFAFAGTQLFPSSPVMASEMAPVTLPGIKINQHPCRDIEIAHMTAVAAILFMPPPCKYFAITAYIDCCHIP